MRTADDFAAIRQAHRDGLSIRQIARQLGVGRNTVLKALNNPEPQPYTLSRPRPAPTFGHFREVVDAILAQDEMAPHKQRHIASQVFRRLRAEYGYTGGYDQVRRYLQQRRRERREESEAASACPAGQAGERPVNRSTVDPSSNSTWILRLLLGKERLPAIRAAVGDCADLPILYRAIRNGGLKRRIKALVVLASCKGMSLRRIARILGLSWNTVRRYLRAYNGGGSTLLFSRTARASSKRKDKAIQDALFEVLHSPPSTHGINRTTWKMADLRMVLAARGVDLSVHTIRVIIRDAGYRWRKAKEVLTSNDPYYREKLMRMTAILSALKPEERFFSIDEFGPFAVKIRGGRVLVGPGEVASVPQFQKSKGRVLVTAALELSTNQVTHFYSAEKNTGEMLKLIDRLLDQYESCEKLYLSWDAASWHDSYALHARVEAINSGTYRAGQKTPKVEFVPLPSRAQFLNVIESVFSGMARAIIHNSDYRSVDEATEAIDRYFRERNEHFRLRPKRAGKKIWGKEPAPSEFSESNNCKEPKWCRER